jgi:hypothetical protein
MHLTNDQLFDMLCQARDRLEAGPAEGPERSELFAAYLQARGEAFGRTCVWERDPLPSMNRRFLVLNLGQCLYANFVEDKTLPRYYFEGLGRGWSEVRALPPPCFVLERPKDRDPEEPEEDDEILWSHHVRGSPIISPKMLAIWHRLDPEALDVLPIRLESHAGATETRDYWTVDVVRTIPAFDEARMGLRRFRAAAPPGADISKYVEYVPYVKEIALRDDLPLDGVHLFRDEIDRERIFISVELALECYHAGAGKVSAIFDWPDQPNFYKNLGKLLEKL